ncbi:hypothetical protein PSECIP111951_00131 [Pseudoalteromonas holothuriae]|uniref:DUF3429 domain-containing protein n=1 Tax=Pseudoalteromonas holothuriae TaxID=2963714 RepID=A0A9W4VNV3_9GAMM|nr:MULTISPECIES: DUF3429 domain-containing protein [unclassified Pseudoalteromonas]CAH9050148.1 hypothetical protein PSECIP111951_00131 [Pseudoalteromonas sp. CIP111951]CAH9052532.1 hypothetical protein PSECIP111854_00988 [Pseudoalteromonas sp. CIP111854]
MHPFLNHIQLSYYGVLPFLACVFWPLLLGSSVQAIEAFSLYSMGILAFMAGTLWRAGEQSFTHAIMAVLVVIPFPLLVFASATSTLVYLAISFPIVLLFERGMPPWQQYHKDYHKMRYILTSVVFVCHLFMIAQSIELARM